MKAPIGNDMDYLGKLLDVTTRRQEVHAANLANVNTQGYRRSKVRFEEALNSAGGDIKEKILNAEIQVVEDREAPTKPYGSNVDLDKELSMIRKNALLHQVFSEFLSAKIRLVRAAILGRNV